MAMIEINRDPTPLQLKQFGWLWLAFFGGFALLRYWRSHFETPPWILLGVALLVPIVGWIFPPVMRAIFVGASMLTWPIGFVISHLLMVVIYYLVLTPIALVMRVVGYDPMARKPKSGSYWIERPKIIPTRRYFRQF